MGNEILQVASGLGPAGVLVAFMMWQQRERKEVDEKRIAADIKTAEELAKMATSFGHVAQLLTERLIDVRKD